MTSTEDSQAPAPGVSSPLSRRAFLRTTAAGAVCATHRTTTHAAAHPSPPIKLSTFRADVTVPVGHGMMGGAWRAKSIADPLDAHGIVLCQGATRVVFVSVDWCEIRNDAYDRWQKALAQAVDTQPERVLISTVHQHDAPVADLGAERLLRERNLEGSICDPDFHERAMERLLVAARLSLQSARTLSHIGTGKAAVEKVASNRRYSMPDGQVRFDRTSSTRNAFAIEAGEGLVDPDLRTLSFWDRSDPIAALTFFAVHPMSHYGQGEVSADFPGLARRARQTQTPGTHQIYCSGCSGNITAGKYNNGEKAQRAVLATRLQHAMEKAWQATRRQPLDHVEFRMQPVTLDPRTDAGFSPSELEGRLLPGAKPFDQCLAAMGLNWHRRCEAGKPLQIPLVDLGAAQLLLLPGEAYVEYQLAAQKLRPDLFVCVAGYGDGATGYIPTERHFQDKDPNLKDWCWVAPGSESRVLAAMKRVMKSPA